MRLLHVCPICGFIRRITEGRQDEGITGSLIQSGAHVKNISPDKCKNPNCKKYQSERLCSSAIAKLSYQEFCTSVGLVEDPRLKFLKT